MTAEVAVMNNTGVAMAADSAVTTGFPGREKIFTTANKIFTLSKFEPVGVMINGHVEHFGHPWEVLIKNFRATLHDRSFGSLREYVELFISEITDPKYLNHDGQTVTVIITALSTFGELQKRLERDHLNWRASDIRDVLDKMLIDASRRAPIPGFEDVSERQFNTEYAVAIDEVTMSGDWTTRKLPQACKVLFRRVVLTALSHQMPSSYNTGIVFAGYGRDELHPKLVEISIDGGFLGKVRHYEIQQHDVAKDGATISSFAQDDIVNSFLDGIDGKFSLFHTAFFTHSVQLIADEILREHTQLDKDAQLVALRLIQKRIDESVEDIQTEGEAFAQSEFRTPVEDVLRTAPKEMLAELAESLVSITSLRKRVSGELETVGGPVDVALISKGEGFIWIKRKHYFDTQLNPHYTSNYFRSHEVKNGKGTCT